MVGAVRSYILFASYHSLTTRFPDAPVIFGRVLLLAVIGYIAFLGYVGWQTVLRLKQVRNCANLQTLTFLVESYREKTGSYPASIALAVAASSMNPSNKRFFSSATDAWGHQYYYRVRGHAFILISFGRDGIPDQVNYWDENASREDYATCRSLGADIFANRSGVVRCCGK